MCDEHDEEDLKKYQAGSDPTRRQFSDSPVYHEKDGEQARIRLLALFRNALA